MQLDQAHPISDLSAQTLAQLVTRIELSRTEAQFVYRECELDEVWRLLDAPDAPASAALRDAVERAHDLVGMEGKPAEAAQALRDALG
jgi:hypothetical protein